VINTTKNQSIHNPSVGGKPRIELTEHRNIVPNDVVTNKATGILKELDTFRDRLLTAFIIEDKSLFSVQIIDANTVNLGAIIV
jgi:hypothetical protein